jgi:hypothetical protein
MFHYYNNSKLFYRNFGKCILSCFGIKFKRYLFFYVHVSLKYRLLTVCILWWLWYSLCFQLSYSVFKTKHRVTRTPLKTGMWTQMHPVTFYNKGNTRTCAQNCKFLFQAPNRVFSRNSVIITVCQVYVKNIFHYYNNSNIFYRNFGKCILSCFGIKFKRYLFF